VIQNRCEFDNLLFLIFEAAGIPSRCDGDILKKRIRK